MMRTNRRSRWIGFLPVALASSVLLHASGCGNSKGDNTVVQVDPEFSKKTSDMLEKMKKDQMAKYKKAPGRK